MDTAIKRRIDVAACWASSRIAALDSLEQYEDSYAITQEFREWITGIGEHPEHLQATALMVPASFSKFLIEESSDTDEVLEI